MLIFNLTCQAQKTMDTQDVSSQWVSHDKKTTFNSPVAPVSSPWVQLPDVARLRRQGTTAHKACPAVIVIP